MWASCSAGPGASLLTRKRCDSHMLDVIYVALTVVLFGALALVLRAVERL